MVKHPIHVRRSAYSGRDPKKLAKRAEYNRDAAMLEKYCNEQIEKEGPGVYHYYKIARAVGLPESRVHEILFSVDCGHNGFTVSHGSDGKPAEFFTMMNENQSKHR